MPPFGAEFVRAHGSAVVKQAVTCGVGVVVAVTAIGAFDSSHPLLAVGDMGDGGAVVVFGRVKVLVHPILTSDADDAVTIAVAILDSRARRRQNFLAVHRLLAAGQPVGDGDVGLYGDAFERSA